MQKLPPEVNRWILEESGAEISAQSMVGGGCINQCFHVSAGSRDFFIKLNNQDRYPGMFEAEFKGLEALAAARTIQVPKPLNFGPDHLIIEWLESHPRHPRFWEAFGKQLADMHRRSSKQYGFESDNYIGALPQSNDRCKSWYEFFATRRLIPQLKLAQGSGLLDASILSGFDRIMDRLEMLLIEEAPSLLHGDLWNGNFVDGPKGLAALVDPAVYYGHREVDLAMTQLFGGFHQDFYEAYHESFPLSPGWEQRCQLYNLYPLLVHVNLFGASYVASVRENLKRFL